MSAPEVRVHHDAAALAEAVADRLVTQIVAAQTARGSASVVLTGGGIGTATLRALNAPTVRSAVDWRRLDVWWGDERFLPSGHPDRNETQARAALLDHVPLDPARVHPMPASSDSTAWSGNDPEGAAEKYAAELAEAAEPGSRHGVPVFDVLLLGVGPDAHVASLFPEQAALHETVRTVVGVRGAPKPPPVRVTMTMRTIQTATQVWLLAAGSEKAAAIRLALSDAGAVQVPAAGARGRSRTLVLLDESAASQLPPGLDRIASQ
jgi:6-phosphogluconolactonase